MSEPNEQHGAYNTQQRHNESTRDVEARALLASASKLEEARKPGTPLPFYTNALQKNQRLWMIFYVALCDAENSLPLELKRNLLNLCNFINKHSLRALPKYQPDLLKTLIDINRRVAAGLNSRLKMSEPVQEKASVMVPPAEAPAGSISTIA
jgi:flagellar protein FlaF